MPRRVGGGSEAVGEESASAAPNKLVEIRLDGAPEFTSNDIKGWAAGMGISTLQHQAKVERAHRTVQRRATPMRATPTRATTSCRPALTAVLPPTALSSLVANNCYSCFNAAVSAAPAPPGGRRYRPSWGK